MQQVDKKFGFRKTKDTAGNDIPAPEPITLPLQLYSLEDIRAMLDSDDQKVQELLVDAVNTPVINYVRDLIDEDGVEAVRTNGISPDRYSFEVIANLPPSSRGGGIDDETWEGFKKDYVEVMAIASGLDPKRIEVGADILVGKLNKVKLNKPVLEQFRTRLGTWYSNTGKAEEMTKVYQYLMNRVEKFIAAQEPENVLASF